MNLKTEAPDYFKELPTVNIKRVEKGGDTEFKKPYLSDEQNRIINKALSVKKCFLLNCSTSIGKTTIIVKELVRELYNNKNYNILLLAYTNRAVDELCKTINNAIINFDDQNDSQVNFGRSDRNFIRIGNEISCSQEHKHNLLDNIIKSEKRRLDSIGENYTRDSKRKVLEKHRVYISNIASISAKPNLFNLRKFNIVIVDEAIQILDHQILDILSKCPRLILIGDHKQLPARAFQGTGILKLINVVLQIIGFNNRKNPLVKRFYTFCKKNNLDFAFYTLSEKTSSKWYIWQGWKLGKKRIKETGG